MEASPPPPPAPEQGISRRLAKRNVKEKTAPGEEELYNKIMNKHDGNLKSIYNLLQIQMFHKQDDSFVFHVLMPKGQRLVKLRSFKIKVNVVGLIRIHKMYTNI